MRGQREKAVQTSADAVEINNTDKKRNGLRRPEAGDQATLDGLEVRLVTLEETGRFNELVAKHLNLKSSVLVGERMRYVAT